MEFWTGLAEPPTAIIALAAAVPGLLKACRGNRSETTGSDARESE
jgi:hypothetical protein